MQTIPPGATIPPGMMPPGSMGSLAGPMGTMGPMGTLGAVGPMGPMGPIASVPPGGAPPPFMGAPCAPAPAFPAPMMGGPPVGPCGPAMVHPMIPPEVVIDRFANAEVRHDQLRGHLDNISKNRYSKKEYMRAIVAADKPTLADVDWRVPRLVHCKDPKYNILAAVEGPFAEGIQEAKMVQGRALEDQLAFEAYQKSLKEHENSGGRLPPPVETVVKPGVEFNKAVPQYKYDNDLWQRRLELKTLDEAMTGDITTPMPRPVIHSQDYDNFREGKYVKDDCYIA